MPAALRAHASFHIPRGLLAPGARFFAWGRAKSASTHARAASSVSPSSRPAPRPDPTPVCQYDVQIDIPFMARTDATQRTFIHAAHARHHIPNRCQRDCFDISPHQLSLARLGNANVRVTLVLLQCKSEWTFEGDAYGRAPVACTSSNSHVVCILPSWGAAVTPLGHIRTFGHILSKRLGFNKNASGLGRVYFARSRTRRHSWIRLMGS